MSWWALDVRSEPPERDEVAAWLVRRTGHAVEERGDGELVAFQPDQAGAAAVAAALAERFGVAVASSLRKLERTDWTLGWRQGILPRRFGRLLLTPGWIPPPDDAAAVIVLEPETAFGSGEHGSTRAALRLLESILRPGMTVLDLGAGSGILTIAAAKLDAFRAIGIEIDPEALVVAERNAANNGVADRVAFLEGDAAVLTPLVAPVDVVVANILRQINIAVLPEVRAALRPDGRAIFSGMEMEESTLFRPVLERTGFVVERELVDDGWWSVLARPV